MQVAVGDARGFKTDRCPVQPFEIRGSSIDGPTFCLRWPFDPDHSLEIADEVVAQRRYLGVNETNRDIVDIARLTENGELRVQFTPHPEPLDPPIELVDHAGLHDELHCDPYLPMMGSAGAFDPAAY